jgi:polyhydroxyalkanoate synthesis regulator phasin
MAENDGYRRYIEAAALLGQITRARAEEIVRELVTGGNVQRTQAQQWVDDLVERSRKATEQLVDIVRSEVANQLAALGLDPEDLAHQAADLLRRTTEAGRRATQGAPGQRSPEPVPAKKTAGSKAAAGTRKAPARKAPAKKAPAARRPGAPGSRAG